jgi:deoxyadenosine/deoxycytidine kinase
MEAARPTTLYLLYGKIAAGKSTLARRLSDAADHYGSLDVDPVSE